MEMIGILVFLEDRVVTLRVHNKRRWLMDPSKSGILPLCDDESDEICSRKDVEVYFAVLEQRPAKKHRTEESQATQGSQPTPPEGALGRPTCGRLTGCVSGVTMSPEEVMAFWEGVGVPEERRKAAAENLRAKHAHREAMLKLVEEDRAARNALIRDVENQTAAMQRFMAKCERHMEDLDKALKSSEEALKSADLAKMAAITSVVPKE